MDRRWLVRTALLGVIGSTAFVFAKPGVVVTRDGRKLEGEVTERDGQVIINIHGVDTIIPRDDVTSINVPEAFNKEFADRLAKLPEKDVAGRIALARWTFDQRQYGKAREALDSALTIDPNNREAVDFQNVVTSQLKLESNKTPGDTRATPTPPPAPNGVDRRYLQPADINTIRQKELQTTDRVGVRFENGVEKRYMLFANVQFSQFNALKPVDKALEILNKGDDTMKPDVKILNDPASIAEYRRAIQPFVLNGCAANNCHGGTKGGDFILYNPGDNEPASYTNLYVLSRYRKKINDTSGGVFGAAERKMIDRGHGAKSILAQYGLPVEVAEADHPKVEGYTGIMRNADDLRFKQIVNWMDNSLKQPDPDYGIKFEAPRPAATQPATNPTR